MNPSSRRVPLTTADPLGGRWGTVQAIVFVRPREGRRCLHTEGGTKEGTEGRVLPGSGLLLAMIEK